MKNKIKVLHFAELLFYCIFIYFTILKYKLIIIYFIMTNIEISFDQETGYYDACVLDKGIATQ